jgi:hypothetical protein
LAIGRTSSTRYDGGHQYALDVLAVSQLPSNARAEPVELELWRIRNARPLPIVDSQTSLLVRVVTRYSSLLLSLSPDSVRIATIAENRGPDIKTTTSGSPQKVTLHYQVIELRSGRAAHLPGVE